MANTPKKELYSVIKGANPGSDKRRRDGYLNAMSNLLDTAQTSTPSPITTTVSESGVVNIELVQPANTVLEDIIILCTAASSHDTATIGFRAGTAVGGEQVVAGVATAVAGPDVGTSTTVGQGTSIHSKIATALQGGAPIIIVAGAAYTATERTIHCQVSASTGAFDTNTGAFRAIGKYYNLL
jgi:hypothetical protein